MDPSDQSNPDIEVEDEKSEDFDEEGHEIEPPLTTAAERIPVRVHDYIIKGNTRTKDSLIESHVADVFANVSSAHQLLSAASVAEMELRGLGIFNSVNITCVEGPLELPGTANVVIEVVEPKSPFEWGFGYETKPEARSWCLLGSAKLKNWLGYGDWLDCHGSYCWGHSLDVGSKVRFPRFKSIPTPVSAEISLLSRDWLKFSSYIERARGLTLGLLSTKTHDVSYNLSLRTLTDPSQASSKTVRRQLGHGLLSALKYTFKIDERDSTRRPMRGYAFVSTTQVGGLFPDCRSLRFFRQEFDLRYAIPFGFYGTALNLGISGGAVFPWGNGFLKAPSFLPERFFMRGNGPASILGLGPTEPRRLLRDGSEGANPGSDFVGGDLELAAFTDLSFDLPSKALRDIGVHGHLFARSGSLNKVTENAYKTHTFQKFKDSFRTAVGFGIVIPTSLGRMEINYCYNLQHEEHDRGGNSGIKFSFNSL